MFLKLLDRHFPREHKFHKIFNCKHSTKKLLLYEKMGSIISSYNKQVLQPRYKNYGCNCRKKENCPLENTNDERKKYLDVAETLFKKRCSKHMRDFKRKKYIKQTELSKYI